MEDMVYTVEEVAAIIKSSKNYVYELIKAGHIKILKLPKIKIRKSEREAFLEKFEGYDLTDPKNPVLIAK